jgi:hypothetical protein
VDLTDEQWERIRSGRLDPEQSIGFTPCPDDGSYRRELETTPETITMELPVWMVKQLKGKAKEDARSSYTQEGKESSEEIASLLSYHLDEHATTSGTRGD